MTEPPLYDFKCALCKRNVGSRWAYFYHGHAKGRCKKSALWPARSSNSQNVGAAAAAVAAAAAAADPHVSHHDDDEALVGAGGAEWEPQTDALEDGRPAAASSAEARAFRELALEQQAAAAAALQPDGGDTDAELELLDACPDAESDRAGGALCLSSASVPRTATAMLRSSSTPARPC
jgi:hypothetical protein